MTVKLSELRVAADFDASGYTAGMREKVLADKAGTVSAQTAGAAFTVLDGKVSASGDNVTRLARRFEEGFRATETFERGLRTIGSALDRGQIDVQRATVLLDGMHQKLGLVASESQLAAAGNRELAQAAAILNARLAQTEAIADQTAGAMGRLNSTAMLQRQMMFQLVDIGQALPLLLQGNIYGLQNVGFQFAQIGQTYYGQGGMGAALRDAGDLLGRFALKLAPVAGAAIVAETALASLTHEINRGSRVQVSQIDVVIAAWQLLSEKIGEAIAPIVWWFAGLWDQISPHIADLILGVVGAFDLGFRNVRTIWERMPSALGEFAIQTANNVIDSIESMLNGGIDLLNGFTAQVNGLNIPGLNIGLVGAVDFGAIANPFAGGQDQLALQLAMNRMIVEQTDYLGVLGDRAREVALARRELTDEEKKAIAAYAGIIRGARERIAAAELEARTIWLTAEAAARLTYEQDMLNKALQAGLNLTPQQRAEIAGLAAEQAAAEERTRQLTKAFEDQQAAVKVIGDAFADLFDAGKAEKFFDTVLNGFAGIGRQNLTSLFNLTNPGGLGAIGGAANDNNPAGALAAAVQAGARAGTAEGAASGLQGFLQRNGGAVSAGLGGLGMGYQSQSPLSGTLGGALSGFAAGGPIGALIGGIGGLIGGILGMNKALEEARQKVDENRMAIEQFIAAANGTEVSGYAKTLADLQGQAADLIRLAEAARDYDLAARLRMASEAARGTLAREYRADLTASLNELQGNGYLNKVTEAQDLYNQRLRDAAALGISAAGAGEEFNLRILDIARNSGLSENQLRMLALRFPSLNSAISGIIEQARLAERLGTAQERLADAQAELRRSYDETRGTLEGNISRLGQFRDGLAQLQTALPFDTALSPLSPTERLAEAQRLFETNSQASLSGDPTAQGRLQEVARQYLNEARQFYGSGSGYAAIYATVQGALDQAIASAGGQIAGAESQLEALNQQTSALIEISVNTKTMAEATADLRAAIDELKALQAEATVATVNASGDVSANIKLLADITSTLANARAA